MSHDCNISLSRELKHKNIQLTISNHVIKALWCIFIVNEYIGQDQKSKSNVIKCLELLSEAC